MNIREKCCSFTGHRIIKPEHLEIIQKNLSLFIENLHMLGITDFITGGALGFDTLAANAVIEARKKNRQIRLVLALPCKNQTKGWRKSQIAEYKKILDFADEVIYVSDEYFSGCLHKRNRFMVTHSAHCIFYLTSERSGTAYTLRYAIENNLQIHNILLGEVLTNEKQNL